MGGPRIEVLFLATEAHSRFRRPVVVGHQGVTGADLGEHRRLTIAARLPGPVRRVPVPRYAPPPRRRARPLGGAIASMWVAGRLARGRLPPAVTSTLAGLATALLGIVLGLDSWLGAAVTPVTGPGDVAITVASALLFLGPVPAVAVATHHGAGGRCVGSSGGTRSSSARRWLCTQRPRYSRTAGVWSVPSPRVASVPPPRRHSSSPMLPTADRSPRAIADRSAARCDRPSPRRAASNRLRRRPSAGASRHLRHRGAARSAPARGGRGRACSRGRPPPPPPRRAPAGSGRRVRPAVARRDGCRRPRRVPPRVRTRSAVRAGAGPADAVDRGRRGRVRRQVRRRGGARCRYPPTRRRPPPRPDRPTARATPTAGRASEADVAYGRLWRTLTVPTLIRAGEEISTNSVLLWRSC